MNAELIILIVMLLALLSVAGDLTRSVRRLDRIANDVRQLRWDVQAILAEMDGSAAEAEAAAEAEEQAKLAELMRDA